LPAEHEVQAVAFRPDGRALAVVEGGGDLWLPDLTQLTDPYAGLCADVGLPGPHDWSTYAPRESEPVANGSCLQWSDS
jgi:hypothetical protein